MALDPNIARSLRSGRAFVRASIDADDLKGLARSLSYLSRPEFIFSKQSLRSYARTALSAVKANFPSGGANRTYNSLESRYAGRERLRLREGWSARTFAAITGAGTGIGFEVYHRKEEQGRISTILASLNNGSRAWDSFLTERQAFRFPGLSGKMVVTSGEPLHIPAREGLHYIEKAEKLMDEYVASEGTRLESSIADVFEGRTVQMRQVTDKIFAEAQAAQTLKAGRGELYNRARSALTKRRK